MSKSGFAVIVAGPDLAKAMPKMFKQGASYVIADAKVFGQPVASAKAPKAAKPAKTSNKAAKAPKAPKAAKPAKTPKPNKPSAHKGGHKDHSDVIVKFVKANPGTNMTAIEAHTKLPQVDIRKALNDAREDGSIRTEGQRRGLTYFADSGSAHATASAPAATTAEPTKE
jgi:hypothetical protein